MKPIAEMVDRCLELMKPSVHYSWREWYEDIILAGAAPGKNTVAFHNWSNTRSKIKHKINRELLARKRPERLQCVGNGRGIFLLDASIVATVTAEEGVRKLISCFEYRKQAYLELATCTDLKLDDKKMLKRLGSFVDLQESTILGMIAKMKSLPTKMRTRLIADLSRDDGK